MVTEWRSNVLRNASLGMHLQYFWPAFSNIRSSISVATKHRCFILKRKRELVALLLLSYGCLVAVNGLCLFLKVSWVGLQCVIVLFPDHTHFLFYCNWQDTRLWQPSCFIPVNAINLKLIEHELKFIIYDTKIGNKLSTLPSMQRVSYYLSSSLTDSSSSGVMSCADMTWAVTRGLSSADPGVCMFVSYFVLACGVLLPLAN